MSKLFYLPLEPYVERYTYLMSKELGWAETHFRNNNVPFIRVEGRKSSGKINVGSVVDAFSRSQWAMAQIDTMIEYIKAGGVKDGDVIYTEDFWHPGVESLFYIRDITKIKFKIGCFMHAQSIDESDFTYPMRYWIRDTERGLSKGYDYVFVTSSILASLAGQAGWNTNHILLTGLPYNMTELLRTHGEHIKKSKERFVLFSSRFDTEKNPHFFLDLVEQCPDINFKLVKPRAELSNDSQVTNRAKWIASKLGSNLEIVDTSEKSKYYDLLGRAEIQFNCAIQDWVSWTLLEAITFKCKPLYPEWKDFPYELKGFENHLYSNRSLADAEKKLRNLLNEDFDEKLMSIPMRHHDSWKRKLQYMGLLE